MIEYKCDRCKCEVTPMTMTTLEIDFGEIRTPVFFDTRTAHLCTICRGTLMALLNGEPM